MKEHWLIDPGKTYDLAKIDASSSAGTSRDAATADIPGLHDQLYGLHDRLWAEARQSLLVVLQGMDASGKDGTISHVFEGVNPQGTRVVAFKQPSEVELAHDFLWRVHKETPSAGEIGIFNRSHYEDVLVVRVHGLIDDKTCRERFGLINSFEALLDSRKTTVVKIFLHISKDEQRNRILERINIPEKHWKVRQSDIDERRYWDDYQRAFNDVLNNTSTTRAPWYVVPANHKWYRNWAISHILIETLQAMNPRYPTSTVELDTTGL